MSPKTIGIVTTLLILMIVGGFMFYGNMIKPAEEGEEYIHISVKEDEQRKKVPERNPIDELNKLANQVSTDIRAEMRLNLSMMAQLRSYQEMLKQVQGYAQKVEKDIDIIKEISKDQFQDDVKLQASLFSGKKPATVAKHLEEFRSSRVGAILAKMKKKEASAVLDIWAKSDDIRISSFYRQVMSSYLNNKRRDANPELFNKLKEKEAVTGA